MDDISEKLRATELRSAVAAAGLMEGEVWVTVTLDKMEQRVQYDLYYIEHWSLWFDLYILARTIIAGFIHKNAY